MIETTPRDLNNQLCSQIESVLSYLLPGGKQKGHEWIAGSLSGEKGKSFAVRMTGGKTGVWSDFATGESGGDLLDLWKEARQISFVETLDQVKVYLGIENDSPKLFNKTKYKLPGKPRITKPSSGMEKWFSGRGVTVSTLKRLSVAESNGAICFPYISPEKKLELCKFRAMDEKKFWSNKDPIPCLFGWQAVEPDHRNIVICEGEVDCLSFWEQGIPALSIPFGAGKDGKQKWIDYEYDRLSRFDNLYICMDSDEAGDIAKNDIVNRLGRDRCKIVGLHVYKDANQVLMSGDSLQAFLDEASTEDPDELCQLSDFHNDILNDLQYGPENTPGIKLPWEKSFNDVVLRPGETSVWAGINSHGKSCLLSHVIVDGISQGERFCVASMEMPPASFGNEMYKQIGWYKGSNDSLTSGIFDFVNSGIWIFNSYGTAKAERIMEVFDYARKRYGITNFVIDSLAKCGFNEDDYNGQKGFVDVIADFAVKNDVHVHIVVHVRKRGTEDDIPGKFDIKGTGAIIDMVSNAFIVWRNKAKETRRQEGLLVNSKDPDAVLNCVKQRKTGIEPMYQLWFNPLSRQFLGNSQDQDKQYIY